MDDLLSNLSILPLSDTSGTHLNYYMFWGSYNRAHQAAGGITNFYAAEAALCPSGQRHQPKYSQYAALHEAMKEVAPILLAAPTSLWRSYKVKVLDSHGNWIEGQKQRAFAYIQEGGAKSKHVLFVENDEDASVFVDVSPYLGELELHQHVFTMSPVSAIVVVDGIVKFDSAAIDPRFMAFQRDILHTSTLFDWSSWPESVGASKEDTRTRIGRQPIEQTRLNIGSGVSSQYSWYETTLNVTLDLHDTMLWMDAQRSSGLLVFVDGQFVGDVEDHSHLYEGDWSMFVTIPSLSSGTHLLSILSESFGHSNLIGRFGNSGTGPKSKGITGDVWLALGEVNVSLVDGRDWRSFPGLHGEGSLQEAPRRIHKNKSDVRYQASPTWYSALFSTPTYDPSKQGLFLEILRGRGHVWLNGKDLGRFWNITRSKTVTPTQNYYFLPPDFLRNDAQLNVIVIFDIFGSTQSKTSRLVMSSIISSEIRSFQDEVSFPQACI